jgi:baseplate J-like protein
MDRILDAEQLIARAESLAARGANGLRLAYVALDAADPPAFAWLDVEFFNSIALSPLPAKEQFLVEGGIRRTAGAVAVTEVHASPDGNPAALRLKLAPLGDYSTYILSARLGAMDPLFNRLQFKFRPGCFNLNCAPEKAPAPPAGRGPAIDYLARDYDSFRHVLMAAMSARVRGWAPSSEADLDQVLIDLIAARADELADAHDRVLNERSIATARQRVSLARHARLLDYHIHQGNQASTTVAVQVAAQTDLPSLPGEAWLVHNGRAWNAHDAVLFALFERPSGQGRPWRRRVFAELSDLRLYTWEDAVSALAKGATSADLTIGALTSEASAKRLRDLLLGAAPEQTGAPADVDASVERLLIEEVLNPASGTGNGRDLRRRQLLRLVPGPARAEAMQDPVSGQWFCRVRWIDADALRENFCFVVDCGGSMQRDVSRFFGNLVDVTQGRPRETTFFPPGAPLPAADDAAVIATRAAHWTPLTRQRGARDEAAGTLARLPRDATIGPLAYQASEPGGETPPRSTLVVRLQGFDRPWDERIDLIESDGTEEHYVVETDERQESRIRFGDGVNGAPLPTGAIIRCRYQSGQGIAGNIGADTLRGSTAPAVQKVWNPLDVVDGREPEPRDEIVRRAPEAYRRRQRRAVTLEDYAREAERVEGVSHARARYAWCGSWRAVQVVIDPVGGGVPGPQLIERLAAALDAVRLIGDDVEIRAAAYVPLDIKLVLCAHPAYWIEDLRAELAAEFSDGYTADGRAGLFHPERWSFGQSLYASQLIGRALQVQGVDRVLRVSMRRFNPGTGGGLVTVQVAAADLPESVRGRLDIGAFEIPVVANDPDRLERGRIAFDIRGGRR